MRYLKHELLWKELNLKFFNNDWVIAPGEYTLYQEDNKGHGITFTVPEEIPIEQILRTILFNLETVDMILGNTIKNENGEETETIKFNNVMSLATYIKAMNHLNIEYVKKNSGIFDKNINVENAVILKSERNV